MPIALVAVACGGRPVVDGPAAESPERARVLRFWRSLDTASRLRLAGDCASAARSYEQALRDDPRHEDSLYYLGQCRRELRDPHGARNAFEQLVEANSSSSRGHLALAALLASPEPSEPLDLRAAEVHLRRAHEINGEETGPMLRLGEVLLVAGRESEARTWLEAAAKTNAKSVEAAFLAGYLDWEAGDRAGARVDFLRAVRAAHTEVPPKGVLGEGDRKASGSSQSAAPPLRDPMGRTLFGATVRPLKLPGAPEADLLTQMDALYREVREARARLATQVQSALERPKR